METPTPRSDFQRESRQMKILYFSNEFPPDDLQELLRRLHSHSKNARHSIMSHFIHEATLAVRDEIRQLPTPLKALTPAFETILELANFAELRKGPLGGAVDGVLLCVVELATLIGYVRYVLLGMTTCIWRALTVNARYYEGSPSEFDLHSVKTCLAGLGIGLLITAAVSSSSTLSDLPSAGAKAVRVAFRLGVLVDEVSQNLQPRDTTGSPDSWAYVVPDATAHEVQQELDGIQAREVSGMVSGTVAFANHHGRGRRKPARSSLAHSVQPR